VKADPGHQSASSAQLRTSDATHGAKGDELAEAESAGGAASLRGGGGVEGRGSSMKEGDGARGAGGYRPSDSHGKGGCGSGGLRGSWVEGGAEGGGVAAKTLLEKLRWACQGPNFDWSGRRYLYDEPHLPIPGWVIIPDMAPSSLACLESAISLHACHDRYV